ncbi:hypothetical protein PROP_01441 [Propionicimonas sp. T2.31MG-18]|uniref:hypothetical protein n=1 Tax=Propionicimonas sp. T2.31MG-18 TaxID=3157620 RepID=UPI0035EE105B
MRYVRIAVVAAAVLAVVGAAAETTARYAVSEQLAARAPVGVELRLNGFALPGLFAGSVPVTAGIDERALARLGDATDVEIDDSVRITTQRKTPLGPVPVTVELQPEVSDGRLVFSVASATAAGVELPERQRAKLAARLGTPTIAGQCLLATAVRLQDHRLVVDASVPIRPDGSGRCP